MNCVGIMLKKNHADADRIAAELVVWLRQRGCRALLESEEAERLGCGEGMAADAIPAAAELVVVLGGDGTLLSAARLVYPHGVPILGVNLGNLGFLTEIARDELYPVLEQVLAGDYRISERMMLDATILRDGREAGSFIVLNDVVIHKGALARIIELEAYVDDAWLSNFRADGLIVATPTGTTGYNLSAGGPIIAPGQSCLALSPICPHSLSHRPIVVSDQATIRLAVTFHDEDIFLTADGQLGMPLQRNDRVIVRRSSHCTQLVTSPNRDYFHILRTKLGWGSRSGT